MGVSAMLTPLYCMKVNWVKLFHLEKLWISTQEKRTTKSL